MKKFLIIISMFIYSSLILSQNSDNILKFSERLFNRYLTEYQYKKAIQLSNEFTKTLKNTKMSQSFKLKQYMKITKHIYNTTNYLLCFRVSNFFYNDLIKEFDETELNYFKIFIKKCKRKLNSDLENINDLNLDTYNLFLKDFKSIKDLKQVTLKKYYMNKTLLVEENDSYMEKIEIVPKTSPSSTPQLLNFDPDDSHLFNNNNNNNNN